MNPMFEYYEKMARAKELGQMDRNLTPEEWAEFVQLVNEGY